jgi:hypothetical protein
MYACMGLYVYSVYVVVSDILEDFTLLKQKCRPSLTDYDWFVDGLDLYLTPQTPGTYVLDAHWQPQTPTHGYTLITTGSYCMQLMYIHSSPQAATVCSWCTLTTTDTRYVCWIIDCSIYIWLDAHWQPQTPAHRYTLTTTGSYCV